MNDRSYEFLRQVAGDAGAEALRKASERCEAVGDAVVPRAVLAWLEGPGGGDYEGEVPGVPGSSCVLRKDEDGGYAGVVSYDGQEDRFERASACRAAAPLVAALGVTLGGVARGAREQELVRLGRSIDVLVRARAAETQLLKAELHRRVREELLRKAQSTPTYYFGPEVGKTRRGKPIHDVTPGQLRGGATQGGQHVGHIAQNHVFAHARDMGYWPEDHQDAARKHVELAQRHANDYVASTLHRALYRAHLAVADGPATALDPRSSEYPKAYKAFRLAQDNQVREQAAARDKARDAAKVPVPPPPAAPSRFNVETDEGGGKVTDDGRVKRGFGLLELAEREPGPEVEVEPLEKAGPIRQVPPEQLHGRRVWVYRNLHNGLFSVWEKGKVVAHVPDIHLRDAKFVVREKGRQRVVREKKKNVHAFVVGTVHHDGPVQTLPTGVTYNPYMHPPEEAGSFVRGSDKSKVAGAPAVSLQIVDAGEGKKRAVMSMQEPHAPAQAPTPEQAQKAEPRPHAPQEAPGPAAKPQGPVPPAAPTAAAPAQNKKRQAPPRPQPTVKAELEKANGPTDRICAHCRMDRSVHGQRPPGTHPSHTSITDHDFKSVRQHTAEKRKAASDERIQAMIRSFRVQKSQAGALCSVCGGAQLKGGSFVGCRCFAALAKSVAVREGSDAYVLFLDGWSADAAASLAEAFREGE